MTEAEKLLALASKAAQITFKAFGSVIPVFTVMNAEGGCFPIHWDIDFTPDNKDVVAARMREVLHDYEIVRYAFATEAWIVDGTKLPDGGASAVRMSERGESLGNHPDRSEVLLIEVEDRETKEHYRREYRILRPEHGEPTLAPPRDVPTSPDEIGRFTHLFE